uniref:HEME_HALOPEROXIDASE domain-containing protein n=1 Tax=Ganoderma boninense TaxID=34458 RepID=A0A5K1JV72_9APHY|nr:HEME_HALOPEROXIDASE domain-containing protein [Ganoderma boninense]
MEEDENTPKALPRWVELEYMHMRTLAGAGATVHFTHLSEGSAGTLSSLFAVGADTAQAGAAAYAHVKTVLELMEDKGVPLEKVCLLDPKAEKELAPEDGDGRFEWFLFGVGS